MGLKKLQFTLSIFLMCCLICKTVYGMELFPYLSSQSQTFLDTTNPDVFTSESMPFQEDLSWLQPYNEDPVLFPEIQDLISQDEQPQENPINQTLKAKKRRKHYLNKKICCGKEYVAYSAFYEHNNTVHKKNNYPCEICGRPFTRNINRIIHQRKVACFKRKKSDFINANGKKKNSYPVICCEKKYSSPQSFWRHKRKIHTEKSDEKQFICQKCGADFRRKSALKRHDDLIHKKIKPHCCEFPGCKKVFTQSYDLKMHGVVHSKIKSYFCDDCGEGFTQCASKNRHVKKGICKKKTNLCAV